MKASQGLLTLLDKCTPLLDACLHCGSRGRATGRTLVDEKIAVQDAGSDLKQIAATLLETEQAVESRVSAKVEAAASDVRSQAQSLAGEIKVLCNPTWLQTFMSILISCRGHLVTRRLAE